MIGLIISLYREYKIFRSLGISFFFWKKYRRADKNICFKTKFLGREISAINPFWFFFSIKEIFVDNVYFFKSEIEDPYIIDCGSNFGFSIIYFRSIFPKCKLVGFEPDPSIFKILCKNLEVYNLKNVQLFNSAVWSSAGFIDFFPNGSLGGRIDNNPINRSEIIQISCLELSGFINKRVDFLKIDIEGAELDVLYSIEDHLNLVQNLFIEYHSFRDRNQCLNSILEIISRAGFRYYIKEAYPIQKFPFVDFPQNWEFDLQLNIFCRKSTHG
ncbi:FkbM family methyltransferase [Algoriphagus sp. NBT04N3]|uniref:FkbM family methyltransferase n=1 Tax=Algoriphagus sp. NBT04N3 TaxID=2705473 RepID=UPI001C635053|nr:FkbM family methyltransferase [Algoriphagus sp. NBT04N3]QYH38003.1 FkbM family methyltransferase [Algoriphagus sp. NBT04N3]